MSRKVNESLLSNAKKLRREMTDVEKFVWYQLRGRRFQGFKFRRQFPVGRYIVDFVCLEQRLILELDGGQHATQQEYDEIRTQYLEREAFRVLRFWNHVVLEDWEVVEEVIWKELQSGHAPLSPPRERG
jgi:very-short-patch-repair endonuclease